SMSSASATYPLPRSSMLAPRHRSPSPVPSRLLTVILLCVGVRDGLSLCSPHAPREVTCAFFLPAEDGIRARNVTGVQTCALPISSGLLPHHRQRRDAHSLVDDQRPRKPAETPNTHREYLHCEDLAQP